jgi:hypothetical protein
MEQLVSKNFQAMKEFEEHLLAFRKQDVDRSSVEEILLSRFEEFFEKVSFFSLFFFIFFSFLFFFPFFFFFFAILLTLSTA